MKRRITVLGLTAAFVLSGAFVFTPASRADHCDRYGRAYSPGYYVGYTHRPAVAYRGRSIRPGGPGWSTTFTLLRPGRGGRFQARQGRAHRPRRRSRRQGAPAAGHRQAGTRRPRLCGTGNRKDGAT